MGLSNEVTLALTLFIGLPFLIYVATFAFKSLR